MSWRDRPAPIPEEEIAETLEADVVVVGLGYAGTAALRAAAEEGVSVIGLEMMKRKQYVSYGRDIGHINSAFLADRGVPAVDPIDLYNEQLRRAGNRVNPSLIMQFARTCGEAFDWFTDMYGVEGLKDVHVAYWPDGARRFKAHAGEAYNGYHFWNGTAQFPDPRGWPGHPTLTEVVKANWDKAEALGARLFFGTKALQPVMDGRRVAGVVAEGPEGTCRKYLARRGVLLSAGDFAGNREMVEDLAVDIPDILRPGQKPPASLGRKGLGHQIGLWAGGRLEPRPLPVMGGNYPVIRSFTSFGVLWLDRRGRRFCNETLGGPEFVYQAAAQMPGGTFYSVFDEHVLEDLQWAVPAHGGFDESNPAAGKALRAMLERAGRSPKGAPEALEEIRKVNFSFVGDNIYAGGTPEELAENAALPEPVAEQVALSIRRYNALCRKGRDEDFGKDASLLRPLEGKLFLVTSEPMKDLGVMLVTVGGFVTDEYQNVLDADYEPIPGLYASGNCCGRRFGPMYTTPIAGVSIGTAMTLGRLAGRNIARAPVGQGPAHFHKNPLTK